MPKQILLVDDSATIHRVVEITFAHEDFAVTAVKTVDEGLNRARQLKPDCVLADAGMAGKTGYDLCGALRADGALGKTPCLILTGNFTPYDEAKGSSSGADGFVVKPFETQGLIDKVKDAIARRSGTAVSAPAPAAAAAAPSPIPVAAKAGIESLGKPLSTVAAETSARIPLQPARPAPMPVPAAPIAAAPPPPAAPQQQQRPTPKATLMGIPAVNPANLPPPAAPVAKPAPPPPSPSQPIRVEQPPTPSQPIRVEPPRPAPAPSPSQPIRVDTPPSPTSTSGPIRVEPPRPAPVAAAASHPSHPTTMPQNVPQMPRASLVPGVAAPRPVAAEPASGIGDVVRQAAERAAAAVPAKIAAAGPEYEAIARLSREVIEQVVWEVVPELAETIIRQELDRLVRERQNA